MPHHVRDNSSSVSMTAYAEIGITTNFSFLRGGSHPGDYVHQASELRIPVIGLADHNTLAGVVRAYNELDNDDVILSSRCIFLNDKALIFTLPWRGRVERAVRRARGGVKAVRWGEGGASVSAAVTPPRCPPCFARRAPTLPLQGRVKICS